MKVMTEELKFADLFPEEAGKLAQRLHVKKDEIPFIRKSYISEKSEVEPKERAVISYISTIAKDRDNEQLLPDGVQLDNYRKNPVVLYGHRYDSVPIGKNLWIKQDEKGLIAKTVFAKSEFADQLYRAYTEDVEGTGPLLKGWSVGFIPRKWEEPKEKDAEDAPKRIYTEWELLEYSAVAIPSCPEALTLADRKSLIPEWLRKDVKKYLEFEVEDFQEEIEIENESKTMTPDELKTHYAEIRRGQEEIEIIAKVESTDNYHRIPVSSGHADHKIRTITVSAKQGTKALYCVDCKKIATYLFDVDKWSMEEAQAWVKDHKGILERLESREARQDEDEAIFRDTFLSYETDGLSQAIPLPELGGERIVEFFGSPEDNGDVKAKEEFKCECPECGHKLTSTEHCKDIKCPECGATMRREDRPGPGKDTEVKRFDLEGNPSVYDIMDAISLLVRPPINSKIYKYVADLYPVKYPNGHVVIEESSEKSERKYFLYSYEYDNGTIKLGESKELEATYQPKKERKETSGVGRLISDIQSDIAELKEGRVLSAKNRKLVKDTIDALSEFHTKLEELYTATEPSRTELDDEDGKELEIEVVKSDKNEKEKLTDAIREILTKENVKEILDKAVKEGVAIQVDKMRGRIR